MCLRKHIIVTIVVCLGFGCVLGAFLQPRIMPQRIRQVAFNLNDTELLSDSLCDFTTNQRISIVDTLAQKDKNLLVFWSPTCGFSKDFFLHQLNEQLVGVYCFPLASDLEYLKFYVEKHSIKLPQIMVQKSGILVPVEAPSIIATPTFVIVDDKGKRLAQYIGINEIDEMITFLYQGIQ